MFKVGDIVRVDNGYFKLTKKQLKRRYKITEMNYSVYGSDWMKIIPYPKNRNYKSQLISSIFVHRDHEYYRRKKLERICSMLEM
jgi:hypothetical protein